MPSSTITRNYSKQLLFVALLLLPLAYIADCALDAMIFGEETFARQIFQPTLQEVAIRGLFSFFMALIVVLALYYLQKSTQLERILRGRNEELNLVTQELEAFNYAVSHDLRNSLTIVYTSMEMLRDHCQLGKNTQCHFLLTTICKHSEKMEVQLESMLLLASSSRESLPKQKVALDELAVEIEHELDQTYSRKHPEFQITKGLNASCNRNLMRMALEHLLGNAVKFIPEGRNGQIEFGQTSANEETIFFVRDNGSGFDPARTEQLFEAFTRLPEAGSIAGTGIGLATVRRIIERHGGRIWAESVPGQGSTFYFTLP
ncbi:MAG TPA: sensor histidine kinase [Tichowtungia sp.]|nr:sensor histidine kinase [Tichowtungia sp.]